GPSCDVLVDQSWMTQLRLNGKVDGTTGPDMLTQLGLAYFPRFLRPAARNVLVIGFGTGTTAGASLLFPDARVTCCEIEPAVFAAAQYFADVNHSPETSPPFSLVLDDRTSYLQPTPHRLHSITSEPSNPWLTGISNLFTQEFSQAARDRLSDDGLLAQWVQTYGFTMADYALIMRTVSSVFPHVALVVLDVPDTVLLASQAPLTGTRASVQAAQALVNASPEVQADLTQWFASTDVVSLLMKHLVLDGEEVKGLVEKDGARAINTDVNMRLEFDAPRRLYQPPPAVPVMREILASARPTRFAEAFERWGGTKEQARAFHLAATIFASQNLLELARQLAAAGLRIDPEQPQLLADRLTLSPREADIDTLERSLPAILALDEARASKVGGGLLEMGRS